jgi:hypothetical protein
MTTGVLTAVAAFEMVSFCEYQEAILKIIISKALKGFTIL